MRAYTNAILLGSLILTIIGCREEERMIAEQVSFRISFSKKLVRTSFRLHDQYRIPANQKVPFDELGLVEIKDEALTSVETTLNANPEVLEDEWPTEIIKKLPGGTKLPRSIPQKVLYRWDQDNEGIQMQLLYQTEPQLIAGGAILSDQFSHLPNNFFASQYFKNSAGAITASISIAGPSENSLGGLYFFGNFGSNPFDTIDDDLRLSLLSEPQADVVWVLEPEGPAEIESWGNWWEGFFKFFSSLRDIQFNLGDQIKSFY